MADSKRIADTRELNIGRPEQSRQLLSRDINYLRDAFLFWPFVFYSMFAVASLYAGTERQIGIRCALAAGVAVLLSKEKIVIVLVAMGFTAIQAIVSLMLHGWRWQVFAVAILTGIPFLLANRYWRKPKLTYQLPKAFGAIDMLWSFSSICTTLLAMYLISPYN